MSKDIETPEPFRRMIHDVITNIHTELSWNTFFDSLSYDTLFREKIIHYFDNEIKSLLKQHEEQVREEERKTEYGIGYFEVKQDEETGRKYWFGAESCWKDPEEVGKNGIITINAESFEVGTVIHMEEPLEQLKKK